MTDEQVLRKAWLEVCETVGEFGRGAPTLYDSCLRVLDVLKQRLTYAEHNATRAAVDKAVRDEREACALAVVYAAPVMTGGWISLADATQAIRARNAKPDTSGGDNGGA